MEIYIFIFKWKRKRRKSLENFNLYRKRWSWKDKYSSSNSTFLANLGKKVILISTDQAHSLGDVLDKKLNGKISQVFQNLDVVEIDTIEESQKVWRNLQDYFKANYFCKGKQWN